MEMYQQPQGSYHSSDSLRRFSSNNPFRQQPFSAPQHSNPSNGSIRSSNAAFDDWVERNKKIINESSDEEDGAVTADTIVNFYGSSISPVKPNREELAKPELPPKPVRTGSDSTVNYAPRMERYV
ncbi:hypothetical protein CLIB1423_07S03554 [[Candida] railenensis]|uniref:Uncharacterized protein n=1 Tax=[Candida] railenensis TaxID=45579 RepID=A0A9P0VXK5_9ASCO|nr:hypothetical protein CLIB1423_07S03554 [[Candida] railenensis]